MEFEEERESLRQKLGRLIESKKRTMKRYIVDFFCSVYIILFVESNNWRPQFRNLNVRKNKIQY